MEPRIVRADIVALDQLLVYNRFGSYNPFGMIFALGRDVESRATGVKAFTAETCAEQIGTEGPNWNFDPKPKSGDKSSIQSIAGKARLRDCKRPRPLVIRGNVGDVLEIRLANLLIDRGHPGPYASSPAGNKPGYTDTFCKSLTTGNSKSDKRFGGDVGGIENHEDALRDASEVACRLAEHQNHVSNKPETWNQPPPATPGDPHLTKATDDADWPSTRHVSLVINGLASLPDAGGTINPACRGLDAVMPGSIVTCRWALDRDGTHFISSLAAVAGGEGDGGSLTHGLFGALIVEPPGSQVYRSQVTSKALDAVWPRATKGAQHARATARIAIGDYDKPDLSPTGHGRPVLNMHRMTNESSKVVYGDGKPETRQVHEVVHSDLNAIVREPLRNEKGMLTKDEKGNQIYHAFREFTAILHDELKTFYTDNYQELSLFGAGQLAGARDGFAINYGASGMGTMLIANRKRIGPAADCVDCLYEESFLQSWVNGDPALLEQYPDDPSNVHHSYLNDRVVFRNFHAGPKETHIFHLHAHQWFAGNDRNRGSYLDSQTVGPQQGFSYRIYGGGQNDYGLPKDAASLKNALGAGNANRTPGDSIFHCHLYPHFAQGMWALWRNHDVLEDGTRLLPDGQDHAGLSTEVRKAAATGKRLASRGGTFLGSGKNLLGSNEARPTDQDFLADAPRREEIGGGGTPIPAIVPLPGLEAPVLPTYGKEGMPGYPFYIPGQAGRRAPQAPMDIARELETDPNNPTRPAVKDAWLDGGLPRHVIQSGVRAFEATEGHQDENKFLEPGEMARFATATLARSLALADFGAHLKSAQIKLLPYDGTPLERRAMAFHFNGKFFDGSRGVDGPKSLDIRNSMGTRINYDASTGAYDGFAVNGGAPRPGAPFADPCALPLGIGKLTANRLPDGVYQPERTISPVTDLLYRRTGSDDHDLMPDPGLIGFRRYEVSAIQLRLVVNRAGWHDPQSRINMLTSQSDRFKGTTSGAVEPFFFRAHSGECIEFRHTNELPKDLARDDFQVKTPTDTIGQHIHLVKFDVMAADGSANGWNYEDGTFAPDEIHHRICAALKTPNGVIGASAELKVQEHGRPCRVDDLPPEERNAHIKAGKHHDETPDLEIYKRRSGDPVNRKLFQTTVQRWFADPLLTATGRQEVQSHQPEMRDRTLRTVFTHDHFGPSSIQQHGFYSALVIEPPHTRICEPEGSVAAIVGKCTDDTNGAYAAGAAPYYVSGGPAHVGARKLVLANAERVASEQADSVKVLKAEIAAQVEIINQQDASPESKSRAEKARTAAKAHIKAIKDGTHETLQALNMREYALAIADFAVLYDPYGKRPADAFYTDKTTPGVGQENAKGLDCLIVEARIKAGKLGGNALARGCDPAHATGMKGHVQAGNVPPAHLAAIDGHDAEKLAKETFEGIRQKFGYPVSPPQRPEAISVDHHDPYLVNYKNEPIPLRVGESSSPAENYRRPSCEELKKAADVVAPKPWWFTTSINRQKTGEAGDMANVFRSTHDPSGNADLAVLHSDPCTPVLEAYEAERVQVRLIQGAQEVQHAFTLEGYTFPRNIDQRRPSKSLLPAHHSGWLDAARTRQRECFNNSRDIPWASHLLQLLGKEDRRQVFVRANCDNIDGRIAAQEIGISEHFEFSSRFNADGQTSERAKTERRRQLSQTPDGANKMPPKPDDAYKVLSTLLGGDNLYHFGTQDALWNGAWGLVRVARNTGKAHENIPEYIDHTNCLAGASPSGSGVYRCRDDLALRLPKLTEIARIAVPSTAAPGTAGEAPAVPRARSLRPEADIVVNCPVDDALHHTVNIAAISERVVEHSRLLHDRNALRLVPDNKTNNASLNELQQNAKRPLVIHVNAGRCLTLKVRNLLDAAPVPHDGDARMPGITSLNVDYGDWDRATGQYKKDAAKDALRLVHSSRLALSIPLTMTVSRASIPAPFGINFSGAAMRDDAVKAAWPEDARPKDGFYGQTLTYYAGTLDASWKRFEQRIKDIAEGKQIDVPAVCYPIKITELTEQHAPENDATLRYSRYMSLDLLGKRYSAHFEWKRPRLPSEGSPTDEEFKTAGTACLLAVIQETKSPEPYASGAVPIKSFGDVIGHTAHGLIGAVVVHPERALVTLETTKDFDPDCKGDTGADLSKPFVGATTQITSRSCLPKIEYQEPAGSSAYGNANFVLKHALASQHTLFWQDGLNLRDQNRRPVADCHVCDDSYDFGKRAVSYSAGMLAERIGKAAPGNRPQVHGAFDLNKVSLPKNIFTAQQSTLHLPPLFSRAGDEVTFLLVHPGGRARQRAFVMTGAGYEDLFPGFGFPSSALLAPGKALSATLLRPARDKECNIWRDGPAYMVGQGVWGLHAVGGKDARAADICRDAAKPDAGKPDAASGGAAK